MLIISSCGTLTAVMNEHNYEALKVDPKAETIYDKIGTEEYQNEFHRTVCENGALNYDKCNEKYQEMFLAMLKERYPAAPAWAVSKYCTINPMDCKGSRNYEKAHLIVHNKQVDDFKNSFSGLLYSSEIEDEWKLRIAMLNGAKYTPQPRVEYRPVYQQPVYQNPSAQPPAYRAPTHYQTNCQSYSWGTQCDTNGR